MRRYLLVLLLALVVGSLVIAGCSSRDDNASITDDTLADAAEKSKPEKTTPTPKDKDEAGHDKNDKVADGDVLCISQATADAALAGTLPGQSQPAEALPALSDPQPSQEEDYEGYGAEGGEESPATVGEHLDLVVSEAQGDTTSEQQSQLQDAQAQIKQDASVPECSGESTLPNDADLHEGEIKLVHGGGEPDEILSPDEPSVDSGQNTAVNESTTGLISSIDKALFPEAQAQGTIGNDSCVQGSNGYNIALVKRGTAISTNDINSYAFALNNELKNHFSNDWYCARVRYVIDENGAIPAGVFPIFLTNTELSGHPGVQHYVGYWPFYPGTYDAYSVVPDWIGSYHLSDSLQAQWSRSVAHEAVEMLTNPYKGVYAGWNTRGPASYIGISGGGTADYVWESADPVQAHELAYDMVSVGYDNRVWKMTDYILPAWVGKCCVSGPPWDARGKWTSLGSGVPGMLQVSFPFDTTKGGTLRVNTPYEDTGPGDGLNMYDGYGGDTTMTNGYWPT